MAEATARDFAQPLLDALADAHAMLILCDAAHPSRREVQRVLRRLVQAFEASDHALAELAKRERDKQGL